MYDGLVDRTVTTITELAFFCLTCCSANMTR
jgi:hypothetical protein